jgi:hypothetical protein
VFGWWNVARILASDRDAELLNAMSITPPTGPTRSWARTLLDGVDDFWEVYEGGDPDGGIAARQIEADLRAIAGAASMVGLVDACEVFSLSVDQKQNIQFWGMLIEEVVSRPHTTVVPPPVELPELVADALADVEWPRPDRIRSRPFRTTDEWEAAITERIDIDVELLADEVLELRFNEGILRHLAGRLTSTQQAALIEWANAEVVARQGEPRPANWPPREPLALPAAP